MNNKTCFTCPMRTLEGERLLKYFKKKGEDYHLIGACVVTDSIELQVINEIKKHEGPVLLYGCISKKITEATAKKNNVKIIRVTELLKMLSDGSENYPCIEDTKIEYTIESSSLSNRDYKVVSQLHQGFFRKHFLKLRPFPFLIISQGCNFQCTFCHSKFYIGKVKSKPVETITGEYLQLIRQKHTFINIIAENAGTYGSDIKSSLPELLERLDSITPSNKVKWMIDGLDPIWFVTQKEKYAPFIAKKRLTVISVPVQSGNVRILKLMNRLADREKTIAALREYKKLNSQLHLQGVFIVGFPTESENDFNDTLSFIHEVMFDDVTFIPYSEFELCESYKIPEKISEKVVNERINAGAEYLKKIGIKEIR